MNLDKEQQQQQLPLQQQQQQQQYQYHLHHHPQHQQQQTTSMALMSSGEYVNFKPITTITTTSNDTATLSTNPSAIAMTICMEVPTPPLSESLLIPNTITTTKTMQTPQTTATFETMGVMTSTFKTPLLPMPTLEDIEGGVIYEQQYQQQQQQPQQIIQTAHIPTGILKYPTISTASAITTSTTTAATIPMHTAHRNTTELHLPLGLLADCISSTVVSDDGVTLTTTAPTATIATTRHKYSILKTTADINNRSISSSCASEIPISEAYTGIVRTPPETTTAITATAATTAQGLRLKSAGATSTTASTTKLNQRSGCCCACFGKKRNDAHSSSDAKLRKTKQKPQTLWSAFIMNVGICALLLAYTFLGELIRHASQ